MNYIDDFVELAIVLDNTKTNEERNDIIFNKSNKYHRLFDKYFYGYYINKGIIRLPLSLDLRRRYRNLN